MIIPITDPYPLVTAVQIEAGICKQKGRTSNLTFP